ncbi:mitochondrial substrate carrier family protein [Wolffia australiana]
MERKKTGLLGIQVGFSEEDCFHPGGLFASVGQMGVGLGMSSNPPTPKEKALRIPYTDLYVKYVSPEFGYRPAGTAGELQRAAQSHGKGLKFKLRVENASLRRLISGAVAGAVSRTTVAPLETIRTHLMVGNGGNSMAEVFHNIMAHEGWTGLFRGNLVNVLRVAPSRAIELFAFETGKKLLTPQPGEPPKTPLPPSLVAGAMAGVCSTLCTYPLELLKTRLTIERGVYENLMHAMVKIVKEEGAGELYRGLLPSVVGVIPYAATNYYAYDALRKAYKTMTGEEEVGNVATLMIGSAAGAIASSATFPLEVARKHMQVGAVGGRQVYKGMLHALLCIFQQEGVPGLYRGLGPSCMKLVPAAGISFMCYEACKKLLTDMPPDADST